jgi:CRISPR-associated protein Csb2
LFAIDVELLTGRYVATSYNDRTRGEWPPHPARFFSALVAALHAVSEEDAQEREALLWLERQSAPSICCDVTAAERSVHDVYVPVNDVTIIGDVERPLREAREALLRVAARNAEKREASRAKKNVEKEEKKLAEILRGQSKMEGPVSATAVAAAAALLPSGRTRQVRKFPSVTPSRTTFSFIWSSQPGDAYALALDRLCSRVTRLGHSASLVRCCVASEPQAATLVPAEASDFDFVLRVVQPGQVERLEAEFAQHRGVETNRVMPYRPQSYAVVAPQVPRDEIGETVFSDDWIVFDRVGGARLLASRGVDLARAIRRALIEQHGTKTLPPSLSGHDANGAAFAEPHVAFVPLPFSGSEHSDGSIQGVAIVLPRSIPIEERDILLRLIAEWERRSAEERQSSNERVEREVEIEVAAAGLPAVRLCRTQFPGKASLLPKTWCCPARRWTTATPIALDRNPGNLRSNFERTAHRAMIEAQRSIAESCQRVGLPAPEQVEVSLAPLLQGVQPVRDFQPFPGTRGRITRVRVHAEIEFSQQVRGPLLLGAGRYYGLGLLRPLPEEVRR